MASGEKVSKDLASQLKWSGHYHQYHLDLFNSLLQLIRRHDSTTSTLSPSPPPLPPITLSSLSSRPNQRPHPPIGRPVVPSRHVKKGLYGDTSLYHYRYSKKLHNKVTGIM